MANLQTRTVRDMLIVRFADKQILDETYCRDVGCELLTLADEMKGRTLILNLSPVEFMASAMIGQLIKLRNKCQAQGIALRVCELRSQVAEAISLMNLNKILNLYSTEIEAMKNEGTEGARGKGAEAR